MTEEKMWGDSISGLQPEFKPTCSYCNSNINEMHDRELCKACIDRYGLKPSTEKYLKHIYIPPRCDECLHNDPDYIVIQKDENGIWMACKWCGYPVEKD